MKKTAAYTGLALFIIFAPGGFLVGAGLAAQHIKKRRLSSSASKKADQ